MEKVPVEGGSRVGDASGGGVMLWGEEVVVVEGKRGGRTECSDYRENPVGIRGTTAGTENGSGKRGRQIRTVAVNPNHHPSIFAQRSELRSEPEYWSNTVEVSGLEVYGRMLLAAEWNH
ncbi:hypothetical protein M0802_003983 [Mischocyttarus mexicanus]|nr:hypothetical protein M0802_003983 [Mischocyttarus mexicanus]